MKVLYKGVLFVWDEENEQCYVMSGVKTLPDGKIIYDEYITEKNPIIAKNMFINRIDGILSKEIADKLEASGRNRYTGELQQ